MYVEVITPNTTVYEGEVLSITFPIVDGYVQILNNHAPYIGMLGKGILTYVVKENQKETITLQGGTVEVLNNKVSVLAEKVIS